MDLIVFLKEYWVILTAILGVIISYVRMESAIRSLKATDEKQEKQIEKNLDLHNKDVVYLQAKLEANSLEFKKIEIALEGLKVNVEFIKQQLNKK
jgi:hypothetical protein